GGGGGGGGGRGGGVSGWGEGGAGDGPFAEGEVHHARSLVHDDEGERGGGVHPPRQRAIDDERDEETQRLVLLLDLPGEPGHGILADHRLADRVVARNARDRHVLAALDLVEVHVHPDLVIGLADALAPDVGVVQAHALVSLGDLVGIEALGLLHRRRPEEHGV